MNCGGNMQTVNWGKGEKNTNVYVTVKGTEEERLLSRKFINKRIIQKNTQPSIKRNYSERK